MKSIYEILTQLQTDLSADLPDLLTAESLADFNNYVIGESREARETALCVYKDSLRMDDTQNLLSLIFQAQLYKVDFESAAKYEDIIKDYLNDYNPEEIGMNILEGLDIDTWPMDNGSGVLIFFTVQYREELDGCD